jgi:hypothetical protein
VRSTQTERLCYHSDSEKGTQYIFRIFRTVHFPQLAINATGPFPGPVSGLLPSAPGSAGDCCAVSTDPIARAPRRLVPAGRLVLEPGHPRASRRVRCTNANLAHIESRIGRVMSIGRTRGGGPPGLLPRFDAFSLRIDAAAEVVDFTIAAVIAAFVYERFGLLEMRPGIGGPSLGQAQAGVFQMGIAEEGKRYSVRFSGSTFFRSAAHLRRASSTPPTDAQTDDGPPAVV